jgi:hypothetical protein
LESTSRVQVNGHATRGRSHRILEDSPNLSAESIKGTFVRDSHIGKVFRDVEQPERFLFRIEFAECIDGVSGIAAPMQKPSVSSSKRGIDQDDVHVWTEGPNDIKLFNRPEACYDEG